MPRERSPVSTSLAEELAQMQKSVSEQIEGYERLWKLPLDNSVAAGVRLLAAPARA